MKAFKDFKYVLHLTGDEKDSMLDVWRLLKGDNLDEQYKDKLVKFMGKIYEQLINAEEWDEK